MSSDTFDVDESPLTGGAEQADADAASSPDISVEFDANGSTGSPPVPDVQALELELGAAGTGTSMPDIEIAPAPLEAPPANYDFGDFADMDEVEDVDMEVGVEAEAGMGEDLGAMATDDLFAEVEVEVEAGMGEDLGAMAPDDVFAEAEQAAFDDLPPESTMVLDPNELFDESGIEQPTGAPPWPPLPHRESEPEIRLSAEPASEPEISLSAEPESEPEISLSAEPPPASDPAIEIGMPAQPAPEPESDPAIEIGMSAQPEPEPESTPESEPSLSAPVEAEDPAIEELEELEELDLDMVESESIDDEAPPLPRRPPAMPPRPAPPTPPPTIEPRPRPSGRMPAVASPGVPVQPFEVTIATPSVLDDALETVGEAAWQARAASLQQTVEESSDPDASAAAAHELGELLERRLNEPTRAAQAYNFALQNDPSLRANLWAIRRIFYSRAMWSNLVRLIEAEIDYAVDDDERAELYVEKGHVLADRMDEPEEARMSYEYALDLMPAGAPLPDNDGDGEGHGALAATQHRALMPALMSLERLAVDAGDESALERILERLVEAVSEPRHKLAYLLDLARLQSERGEFEIALETVQNATKLGVERDQVARAWLHMAELAGDLEAVLAALDALIEARSPAGDTGDDAGPQADAPVQTGEPSGRPREIIGLRRQQVRVIHDLIAEHPDQREALLLRAWDLLTAARELAPDEPLLIADLVDLAEALGRYQELDELCAAWQASEPDPARALALGVRRVDALMHAGQREPALALIDSLSQSAPGYLALTALRERDALSHGDYQALAETYRRAAVAAETGVSFLATNPVAEMAGAEIADSAGERASFAASLYVSAGDVFAHRADDNPAAELVYRHALRVLPGHGPAVEALCDLLERTGQPERATELIERCLGDDLSPERRTHLLERASRLYAELGDLDKSLATDKRLLELDPDGARSIRRALRIESALSALGRWPETIGVLVDLAQKLTDPARRGAALYRAARIADDKLGDPAKAAALYREVAAAWPGDRYARAALISLLRRSKSWDELVAERRAEADELADGPMLAGALREAAQVLQRELGRPEDALDAYRELLVRMPGDPAALRAEAELLEHMSLTDPDQAPELLEALEQEIMADVPDAARVTAAQRMGRTYERLERYPEALESYRRAMDLAADPSRGSTLAAVAAVELTASADDGLAYIEALEQLAEGRADRQVKAALLEEIGWLWANVVEDHERASQTFEQAAEADGTRPGPLLGIALIRAKQKDIEAVGDAMARLGEVIGSPAAGTALMLRAAAIAGNHHEPESTADRLTRAVRLSASDKSEAAVIAAEYALAIPPEQPYPHDTLVQHIALFGARAELAEKPAARHDWLLCQIDAAIRAGELAHARALLRSVFAESEPDIRALQLMRQLGRRGGDRATLARASLMLAENLSDRQARLELYREAAHILDTELGDAEHAAPVYQRILELDPGADQFDRMAAIARQYNDVRVLFEALSARIDWVHERDATDPSLVPLYFERSELRLALGDRAGATRDRSLLLAIDDSHAQALSAQARTLVEQGDAAQASALWQRYLEVETDPAKRAPIELELARILAEVMDDTDGAIQALENVLRQAPDDVEVRERLIGLLENAGQWQPMVEHLATIERYRRLDSERARDILRAARIEREQLGQEKAAMTTLARARTLEPLNLEVIRALFDLEPSEKARTELLAMSARDLRRAIAQSPEKTDLYGRLAALSEWSGDRDGRYFALAAVAALGDGDDEHEGFRQAQAAALAEVPMPSSVISDDEWKRSMTAPGSEREALDRLWLAIAEHVDKCMDVEPGRLGFARGDKVSQRAIGKRFPELAAVVDAFAIPAGEFYISDSRAGFVRVAGAAKPTIFLAADVAKSGSPQARFLLGRAIAQARDGSGGLLALGEADTLAYLAAAFKLTGAQVPDELASATSASQVEEYAGKLQKQIGWLDKRSLGQTVEQLREVGLPTGWWRARICTANRAGLLIAGDVGAALDALAGSGGSSLSDRDALLDLAPWMVGTRHLELRQALGMATKTGSKSATKSSGKPSGKGSGKESD